MDQTAPPPQRTMLDEAESLISWLIVQLEELLAPGTVRPRPMLTAICRQFLLPAEAALRRIIHLIAAKLGPRAPKRSAILPRKRGRCRKGRRKGGNQPNPHPALPPHRTAARQRRTRRARPDRTPAPRRSTIRHCPPVPGAGSVRLPEKEPAPPRRAKATSPAHRGSPPPTPRCAPRGKARLSLWRIPGHLSADHRPGQGVSTISTLPLPASAQPTDSG